MEATPKNLDVNKIHEEILKIKNIKEIHEFIEVANFFNSIYHIFSCDFEEV